MFYILPLLISLFTLLTAQPGLHLLKERFVVADIDIDGTGKTDRSGN
jgi:hypothetical protein